MTTATTTTIQLPAATIELRPTPALSCAATRIERGLRMLFAYPA